MDRRKRLRNCKRAAIQQNTNDETKETTNDGLETEPRKNQHGTSKTTNNGIRRGTRSSTQQNTDNEISETANDGLETEPRKNQHETSKTTNYGIRKRTRSATQRNTSFGSSETTNDGLESEARKNQPGTSKIKVDGLETEPQNNQPGTSNSTTYNLEDEPRYDEPEQPFIWTIDRIMALIWAIVCRKSVGLHKHLSVLLIKMHLSDTLKLDVPIEDIWKFISSSWNNNAADKIAFDTYSVKRRYFAIPQTDDWIQLIEEQEDLIDKYNNTNTDGDSMEPGPSGL